MYYLLNINISKTSQTSRVDEWIGKHKKAPIFYGRSTIAEIKSGKAQINSKPLPHDAKLFADTFSDKINEKAVVFSIGEENIYFYKQAGKLQEYEEYTINDETHLVKGFPIELIGEPQKIIHAPLVLVTIKANRWMSAGTFKLVDEKKGGSYFGNILAIKYLLSGERQKVFSFQNYLQCLSALEFETFIAKLYEERGYYVPAYKGGVHKKLRFILQKRRSCNTVADKTTFKEGASQQRKKRPHLLLYLL